MAAVISEMFTVFIEKDAPGEGAALGETVEEELQVDAADENSLEMGNGVVMELNEGEHAKEANPGRPNTAFDGFVTSICRQIGAALEIPYELLVKNFNASYSASRAALLEAWKAFRMKRKWLAADFCQPIYEIFLTEAIAMEELRRLDFF